MAKKPVSLHLPEELREPLLLLKDLHARRNAVRQQIDPIEAGFAEVQSALDAQRATALGPLMAQLQRIDAEIAAQVEELSHPLRLAAPPLGGRFEVDGVEVKVQKSSQARCITNFAAAMQVPLLKPLQPLVHHNDLDTPLGMFLSSLLAQAEQEGHLPPGVLDAVTEVRTLRQAVVRINIGETPDNVEET